MSLSPSTPRSGLLNTEQRWGSAAILFHWITALVILGLFGLGLWMVELDYYDAWYQRAPAIHKAAGILLGLWLLLRLGWRLLTPDPDPVYAHTPMQRFLAHVAHVGMYILIFALIVTGYLISTADGRGIDVFGWFEAPGFGEFIVNQEDIAGEVHEWLAYILMAIVGVHAVAAIYHQFIQKDGTLGRMWFQRPRR
ncbi:cytochrome b [Biformimicrobium ophioploci]|uniref:Cytochrome b n=1 Tax=Biformimicrobium ophioploci TaxID=3036711 RepID=A0ABQ6M0W4_9GAMM|nr:cytochrome b [Microbulbifer sp. NKW57]GMG87988.1 cytochrome b [Microbulbifer sp. NKW57]